MKIEIDGFEWDNFNLDKLKKHNVRQEAAEDLFYVRPFIDEGACQASGEKRYRCLGVTGQDRLLVAFFTIRGKKIRNISVRPMRKEERGLYEKKQNY